VKSLLRFRCVSKSFCALIDGPNFIKQFLDRSLETRSDFNILIAKGPKLYSLNFPCVNDLEIADAAEVDYPFQDPECEVHIVGSCNGILCLQTLTSSTEENARKYILWNRSTGKYRRVDTPEHLKPGNYSSYFGYDDVKNDYNVVRISGDQDSYQMGVYSLRSNSWTEINQRFPYPTCKIESGGFLHGAVHWLASTSKRGFCHKPELIVAFDLGTEAFRLIPPPNRNARRTLWMDLHALGGHLCVVIGESDRNVQIQTCIWVMEDYGAAQSWAKLFAVETLTIGHFKPFAYYPKGSRNVLGLLRTELRWCFPERSSLTDFQVRGLPDCEPFNFSGCTYVESLVPV
jgi:F-box interacting protein